MNEPIQSNPAEAVDPRPTRKKLEDLSSHDVEAALRGLAQTLDREGLGDEAALVWPAIGLCQAVRHWIAGEGAEETNLALVDSKSPSFSKLSDGKFKVNLGGDKDYTVLPHQEFVAQSSPSGQVHMIVRRVKPRVRPAWPAGTVVRLKSGGPWMTVYREHPRTGNVQCEYFVGVVLNSWQGGVDDIVAATPEQLAEIKGNATGGPNSQAPAPGAVETAPGTAAEAGLESDGPLGI